MSRHDEPLAPLLPDLQLQVFASKTSGELFFQNRQESFRVSLRKGLWTLFRAFLIAQKSATPEYPHWGFLTTEDLTRRLRSNNVAHEVDRLKNKLAKARFGNGNASDPVAKKFRDAIIEKSSLGRRLSIPPENITILGDRDD